MLDLYPCSATVLDKSPTDILWVLWSLPASKALPLWGVVWRANCLLHSLTRLQTWLRCFQLKLSAFCNYYDKERDFCNPCARVSKPTGNKKRQKPKTLKPNQTTRKKTQKSPKPNLHKDSTTNKDLTTNFTTQTTSTGILYQLQWLLMKENYSINNKTCRKSPVYEINKWETMFVTALEWGFSLPKYNIIFL